MDHLAIYNEDRTEIKVGDVVHFAYDVARPLVGTVTEVQVAAATHIIHVAGVDPDLNFGVSTSRVLPENVARSFEAMQPLKHPQADKWEAWRSRGEKRHSDINELAVPGYDLDEIVKEEEEANGTLWG